MRILCCNVRPTFLCCLPTTRDTLKMFKESNSSGGKAIGWKMTELKKKKRIINVTKFTSQKKMTFFVLFSAYYSYIITAKS